MKHYRLITPKSSRKGETYVMSVWQWNLNIATFIAMGIALGLLIGYMIWG